MVRASVAFVSLVSLVSMSASAYAQPADSIGVRAQGMGGAFTAVADDATASWWNPAGIAGGPYFNLLLEYGAWQEPHDERTVSGQSTSARRADPRSFAAAFPALGLSYYRLRISEIQPQTSTAANPGVRQEEGATEVRLRSFVLNQIGVSVGQSLGEHLVLASTLKVLNAGVDSRVQATGSLDEATGIDPSGEWRAALDVGAMATFGPARIGLMVRNVTEPGFGSGADATTLQRSARLGAAVSSGPHRGIASATVAVDGDLTTASSPLGDERRLAAGGEVWTATRTFGFRGGVNVSTIGQARTTVSGGMSAALKTGLYLDGELSGGADVGRKGLGVALRVTF
jgi:hypothetical protein